MQISVMDENCNGNPPSVIVTGNDLDPGGNGMAASDPAAGLNGINLPTTVNIYFSSKYQALWPKINLLKGNSCTL